MRCRLSSLGAWTNIQQVPASKLITSYPIPPQEAFVCAPYSIRLRPKDSKDVLRYTYMVTKENNLQKLTLFKDVVHPDGKTTSSTETAEIDPSPVQDLICIPQASPSLSIGNIIGVFLNGDVMCLSGESLTLLWTSSSRSLVQDATAAPIVDFEVEHVSSTTASEAREGMYKSRTVILDSLSAGIDSNPELVLVVSKCSTKGGEPKRYLTVFSPSTNSASLDIANLIPLEVTPLLIAIDTDEEALNYQIDPQAGVLLYLNSGAFAVYDITGAIPKLRSTVYMDNATTFARLSRPFVISCSTESIGLYNYQYRAIHARSAMDLSSLPVEAQDSSSCELIAYFRSQEIVVARISNILTAIQVESPKNRGKRRAEGLLIDCIGRGITVDVPVKKAKHDPLFPEFSTLVPGSITDTYLIDYQAAVDAADALLSDSDFVQWETLLREKFGMEMHEPAPLTNGNHVNGDTVLDSQTLPEWNWPELSENYPRVDRRWVLYALSQVLSVEWNDGKASSPSLRLVLPDSNVTTFLIAAGHWTLSNLKSAFRDELESEVVDDKRLITEMVACLTDADPSMALLTNYIEATNLGEVEILCTIRTLLQSMGLISDDGNGRAMKLLKDEAHEGDGMDLDDLERDIALSEHFLGDSSSVRSRGLTLAFTKLWRRPAMNTVKALRSVLQTGEIISIIYLLRAELTRGAWTSLYLEHGNTFDALDIEPPPDGIVVQIADLLSRFLDAVGAGGWLFNDSMTARHPELAGGFLSALKLEVDAALECVQEAVAMHGTISEVAGFSLDLTRSMPFRSGPANNQPVTMHMEGRESRMLPLGLKTKQLPSKDKVVSGGEVQRRTARETGHLISKKVEAYSLERLVI